MNTKPIRLTLARIFARSLPPVVAAHVSQRIYPTSAGWNDAYRFQTRARTGSRYCGTTRDGHACLFAIHGYFDWRLLATAGYLCRPGNSIVEVGANVGTETVGLADIVGQGGHVYAFEPEPNNAEQLERSIGYAGLSHVEVIRAAVSDAAGRVTFVPSADERESGSGHLGTDQHHSVAQGVTVDCLTLDNFLQEKPSSRLWVIDAEGAEIRIIRGGKNILLRDQPALIVEAQDNSLRRFGFNLADLYAELQSLNYTIHELARFGLADACPGETRRTRNWLALPPAMTHEATKIHRHLLRCGLSPCVHRLNPLARV